MLVFVNVGRVDAEEGVGDPGCKRGVGEVCVDNEGSEEREEDAEAELVEAVEGVLRPDDIVLVGIEEFAVLLEDRLLRVSARPIAMCGPVGFGLGGGNIRSGGP